MSRSKVKSESMADMFWAFVRDNPKLATTLAFEIGSLAGAAVRNSSDAKKYLKNGARNAARNVPQAFADAMPASVASALKFLPAPKLQPRKTKRAGARRPKSIPKQATE